MTTPAFIGIRTDPAVERLGRITWPLQEALPDPPEPQVTDKALKQNNVDDMLASLGF